MPEKKERKIFLSLFKYLLFTINGVICMYIMYTLCISDGELRLCNTNLGEGHWVYAKLNEVRFKIIWFTKNEENCKTHQMLYFLIKIKSIDNKMQLKRLLWFSKIVLN